MDGSRVLDTSWTTAPTVSIGSVGMPAVAMTSGVTSVLTAVTPREAAMATTKPTAIGYLRVSTDRQAERGLGLEVQEQAIRSWAKANGVRLVDVLSDEGESGANGLDTRVGLAEALARIERKEATQLVVFRLDRLARKLLVQMTIIDRLRQGGADVVSVSEPEVDGPDELRELIRNVLGSIAAYEKAVIRGRLAAGKAAKRARGGYIGGPTVPYGTKAVDGELVVDTAEVRAVEMVKRLRPLGRSYREICEQLEAAGVRTRRGGPWQPKVVRAIAIREGVAS